MSGHQKEIMHTWGEKDVDWNGIGYAAECIGKNLRRFGRVQAFYKEKFGTVRVYCSLNGIRTLHDTTHPGWVHAQYNAKIAFTKIIPDWLNKYAIIPYQKWLYRFLYKRMVNKFPHLREEILSCADYDELLEGL